MDHSIRVLIENGTGGWYGGGTERFYNQRLSLDASLDGIDHALTWISHYLSMEAVWSLRVYNRAQSLVVGLDGRWSGQVGLVGWLVGWLAGWLVGWLVGQN